MKKRCLIFILAIILISTNAIIFSKSNAQNMADRIDDGVYEIISTINSNIAFDITDGSNEENAQIQLWNNYHVKQQKFEIKYNDNGYFTIKSLKTKKYLSVENENPNWGTKIVQKNKNGNKTQDWILKKKSDNTYNITSRCGNLNIDIPDWNCNNGVKLQMWANNGETTAQKFILSKTENETKNVSEGTYQILSSINKNISFDIENGSNNNYAKLQLWENVCANQQKFILEYVDNGYYKIKSKQSGKYLTIAKNHPEWGEKVIQQDSIDEDIQQWQFNKKSDGSYNIISKYNDMSLDVPNWNCNNGVKLQVWGSNIESTAQKFFLVNDEEKGEKVVEDGTYRILSNLNNVQAIDIDCGSMDNGAKAQLWQDYNKAQQKFKIQYDKDGYYKIISMNSNKALTVENKNTRYGTNIIQKEDKNLDTQLWIIKNTGNGTYKFVSKEGNLAISTNNANNGTKLVLGNKAESKNNQFILISEDAGRNATTSIEDGYYNIILNGNKTVEVRSSGFNNNDNVQIWDKAPVAHHKFHIQKVEGENYYKISAVHSAKFLQVQDSGIYIGTNVNQGDETYRDNQFWYIIDCGNGYYNLVSRSNGLYLQTNNKDANGSNIFVGYNNNNYNTKFRLDRVNAIENGPYEIQTKIDENRVLDVDGGSFNNNANIQIWAPQNTNQERFLFEAVTDSIYIIKNVRSGKVLTVLDNGNVVQYDNTESINQKWKVIERGENFYSFASQKNGYCLDVDNACTNNGTNVKTWVNNGNDAQKFKLVSGYRKFYEQGTYGTSGKKQAGLGGYDLVYYKIGQGQKKLFLNFSIHGFEDSYSHDGGELSYMADRLKNYLYDNAEENIINEWTIYILPNLNPDGQYDGWTNNGPGRTTLYSYANNNHGIDLNRCWSVEFQAKYDERNYTGSSPFLAPEALQLRDFILNHTGSKNIVIDTHGWLNETIGDNEIGSYYRNKFGISKHISSYGKGYLVNWVRSIPNTRSMLLELPEVSSHNQVVNWGYSEKFISATLELLQNN